MDDHAFHIVSDIIGVNTQGCDALPGDPFVPSGVALRVFAELMPNAINFDGKK